MNKLLANLSESRFTEVRFTRFLSGGFITAIVVNPPERKLAKCTSVHWAVIRNSSEIVKDLPKILPADNWQAVVRQSSMSCYVVIIIRQAVIKF